MAKRSHVTIARHQAASPVSLTVCARIDACIPNFLVQEVKPRTEATSPIPSDAHPHLAVGKRSPVLAAPFVGSG